MKILYFHQYFKTPEEGGAIRSWYIAMAMVGAGHEVHMITAHNAGKFKEENINGINVYYLPVSYKSSYGFFRRIISFLKFSHLAYRFSKKIKSPDFIYASSTPLTVGMVALRYKFQHHLPYVFEIRDLWPEVPIQLKIIRNPMLKIIARYMERKIYSGAEKIVVLSPGVERNLRKLPYIKSMWLCPNMSDCEFFMQESRLEAKIIERIAPEGKFVISYFGAIGKSNQLDYLLDIAFISQRESRGLVFLIVGEGPMKEKLMKRQELSGLKNVHFIEHQNKMNLRRYLSITDAAYISFASNRVFELNSPNKFFDALASGKMVISNLNGWLRELIEIHDCGFYYPPEEPGTFFEKIEPFLTDPEKLRDFQRNARKLAENKFERKILTKGLLKYLEI